MREAFRHLAIVALIIFLVVGPICLFGFLCCSAYQMGYDTGFDHQYRSAEYISYEFEQFIKIDIFKGLYQNGYDQGISAAEGLRGKLTPGIICLKKPTYEEVRAFIRQDSTDKRFYYSDNYTCYHYSIDVVNHAMAKDIRVGYVHLCFSTDSPGHAIVCFDTVDKGLIFIEPQLDREMIIQIGRGYWEQNGFIGNNGSEITEVVISWSDGTTTMITKH